MLDKMPPKNFSTHEPHEPGKGNLPYVKKIPFGNPGSISAHLLTRRHMKFHKEWKATVYWGVRWDENNKSSLLSDI